MKPSRKSETKQNHQGHTNVPRPDIRDTIDSHSGAGDGQEKVSYKPARKPKKETDKNKDQDERPQPAMPRQKGVRKW